MFNTQKFGGYLSRLRKNADMTQSELADKLNLTRQAVSRYETGERNPPKPPTIKKLTDALKINNAYKELMEAAGYIEDTIIKESSAKYSTDPKKRVIMKEIEELSEEDAEYILGLIKRIKKE